MEGTPPPFIPTVSTFPPSLLVTRVGGGGDAMMEGGMAPTAPHTRMVQRRLIPRGGTELFL